MWVGLYWGGSTKFSWMWVRWGGGWGSSWPECGFVTCAQLCAANFGGVQPPPNTKRRTISAGQILTHVHPTFVVQHLTPCTERNLCKRGAIHILGAQPWPITGNSCGTGCMGFNTPGVISHQSQFMVLGPYYVVPISPPFVIHRYCVLAARTRWPINRLSGAYLIRAALVQLITVQGRTTMWHLLPLLVRIQDLGLKIWSKILGWVGGGWPGLNATQSDPLSNTFCWKVHEWQGKFGSWKGRGNLVGQKWVSVWEWTLDFLWDTLRMVPIWHDLGHFQISHIMCWNPARSRFKMSQDFSPTTLPPWIRHCALLLSRA